MTGPALAGDPQPGRASAAARALVAASTAFLFLAPSAGSAGLRATTLMLAAIALAVAFRGAALRELREFPRALGIALLAWAALSTASLAWSVDRAHTLSELRAEVFYGSLAWLVFYLGARLRPAWRAGWFAAMAGTFVVMVVGFLQPLLPFTISRHPVDGGAGPWSTHLVLAAPLLLLLALPRPWGMDRGLAQQAAALLLLLGSAWHTGNRIVWAAFVAQLVVLGLFRGALPALDAQHSRRLLRLSAIAALAVTLAFAGAVLNRSEQFYGEQAHAAESVARDARPVIWALAMDQVAQAPWFGHGFGREIVAPAFAAVTPASPGHPEIRHAHNVFVDVALEQGLVGLALFLAVLALLAREYLRMLRCEAVAPLALVGLMVLAGFAVKNLTDDFLFRHNGLVFWAVNAMLLGFGREAMRPPRAG